MEDRAGAGTPQLSVVLSSLGNYTVLRRVLDGYEHQDAPAGSFELIVVVDKVSVASSAGCRGCPRTATPGGVRRELPVVLITDNDTIPVPRLVSEHIAWHGRFPAERWPLPDTCAGRPSCG